jgi:hypothetical protein
VPAEGIEGAANDSPRECSVKSIKLFPSCNLSPPGDVRVVLVTRSAFCCRIESTTPCGRARFRPTLKCATPISSSMAGCAPACVGTYPAHASSMTNASASMTHGWRCRRKKSMPQARLRVL